ncbi:cyclic beta 1-2 glucan synthetase [Brucella ovis]|nr:cyclic beta 1-2 glucan synthetase [Brucella ovis]
MSSPTRPSLPCLGGRFGLHLGWQQPDYQLTPWANDPVTNRPGEAIYILDRETGRSFAPTANVLRDEAVTYEARHGHGYSAFSAQHGELALELTHIVDAEKPVRLSRLTITNKAAQSASCAFMAMWNGCWAMPVPECAFHRAVAG